MPRCLYWRMLKTPAIVILCDDELGRKLQMRWVKRGIKGCSAIKTARVQWWMWTWGEHTWERWYIWCYFSVASWPKQKANNSNLRSSCMWWAESESVLGVRFWFSSHLCSHSSHCLPTVHQGLLLSLVKQSSKTEHSISRFSLLRERWRREEKKHTWIKRTMVGEVPSAIRRNRKGGGREPRTVLFPCQYLAACMHSLYCSTSS